MKRKMKKFNEGGKTYEQEDEGILGGKVNYREEDGRKYVAGKANPFDRNPAEQRYYSMDDVKGKLSGLFGGKKEDSSSSKFDELESVGGAGRRPRTIEEQIGRKAEDKPAKGIASNFKSSEPKFERNDNEKSLPDVKKAARKDKGASDDRKSLGDKANRLPGNAADKDKKVTLLPGRGDDKKSLGEGATRMSSESVGDANKSSAYYKKPEKSEKKGFSTKMGKTNEEREAQAKANREALSESVSGISKYFRNPFTEEREYKKDKPFTRNLNAKPTADQMKKMAKGGTVKSASARADGCAIRGKTRA